MDGLQVVSRLNTLDLQISALEKATFRMSMDRDFRQEHNVLENLKQQLEAEKQELKEKLQAINF